MKNDYDDIRERIATPPLWWDEHGVPRYCAFSPRFVASIYAIEVVLLRVTCQSCERPFEVALSWNRIEEALHKRAPLVDRIRMNALEYGDPPNVGCCAAGPTMNSVPRRVLEYWRASMARVTVEWERDPTLEVELRCKWWEER